MERNFPETLEQINDDLFYSFANLDNMFWERVRGIQHVIQVIDHLEFINAEKAGLDALDKNDISGVHIGGTWLFTTDLFLQ